MAHTAAFLVSVGNRYLVAAPAVRLGETVFLPGVASCHLPPAFCLVNGQRA